MRGELFVHGDPNSGTTRGIIGLREPPKELPQEQSLCKRAEAYGPDSGAEL